MIIQTDYCFVKNNTSGTCDSLHLLQVFFYVIKLNRKNKKYINGRYPNLSHNRYSIFIIITLILKKVNSISVNILLTE